MPPKQSSPAKPEPTAQATPTLFDSNWSWSSFSTWPLSLKLSPILIAILGIAAGVFFPNSPFTPSTNFFNSQDACVANFNYTFQVASSKYYAETRSSQPWELGYTAEAILELIDPERSVFAPNPFPRGKIPSSWIKMEEALVYLHSKVRLNSGPALVPDGFSVSDPASLGVAAVMIGKHWPGWHEAAGRQKDYLLNTAPRWENGAISHRVEVAEVWADGVAMFPPFLAYYGVATNDLELVREAFRQIGLYRDVLLITEGKGKGLWRHIVGHPDSNKLDPGAWSTGNGWAAYGMLRVRATIAGWEKSKSVMKKEIEQLDSWILEILSAAQSPSAQDPSGLLRNYLDTDTWWGEIAGTALLSASAYRMALYLQPSPGREKLLVWADSKRKVVAANVDDDGIGMPVVNPYAHNAEMPLEFPPSPEAEAFLMLMGAAWRDCVCAGVCSTEEAKVS